jgi:2-hydroxychromene-2-carboxylate isomerase
VTGEGLQTEADVLAAARRAGLAEDDVIGGLGAPDLKAELKELTDRAVADGVHGVPTVSVGGSMFWGDDQLTSAAAAMAG